MIAIIDYGAGNLKSVKKAFDYIGIESKVATSVDDLHYIEKIVLPGVGAFGAAIGKLHETGFYEFIKKWIHSNKPFLGICLGMQMLFESSTESAGVAGLGAFNGTNLKFNQHKVPQIGWNQIRKVKKSNLLDGVEDGSFFYLLHSYYIAPEDREIIVAETDYGVTYPSVIENGNVYAVQFHPEKSGEVGLKLLNNWVEKC